MTRTAISTRSSIAEILEYWMGRPMLDLCQRGMSSKLSEEDKSLMHEELQKGMQRWFGPGLPKEKKEAVDQEVRDKFQPILLHFAKKQFPLISGTLLTTPAQQQDQESKQEQAQGEMDAEIFDNARLWLEDPRSLLAAIILCDQFPRNIYRGQPDSFAFDEIALALTRHMMYGKHDLALHPLERNWVYMPLEHSEDLDDQKECKEVFEKMVEDPIVQEHGLVEQAKMYVHFADKHLVMIEQFGRFPHRNAILSRESTQKEIDYLSNTDQKYI